MDPKLVADGVRAILQGLDVDLSHPDFKETPQRVAAMYKEILTPPAIRWAMFPGRGYSEMIVVNGHHVWSFCPHHLLPVEMQVSVAYIPKSTSRVPGLSKVPRLVESKARRLVLQEAIAVDIVDTMMKRLKLLGCACFVRGRHLCMSMRGVRTNSHVTTSALRGVFLTKPEVRQEFLNLIHNGGTDNGTGY